MSNHYERVWEVQDELSFVLLDGHRVRIEWLTIPNDLREPVEVRIFSDAGVREKRMRRIRTLSRGSDFGRGWQPVIFPAIDEATSDMKKVPFLTFEEFYARLWAVFQKHWVQDFPHWTVGDPEFREGYCQQEIEEAVATFLSEEEFEEDELASLWDPDRDGAIKRD